MTLVLRPVYIIILYSSPAPHENIEVLYYIQHLHITVSRSELAREHEEDQSRGPSGAATRVEGLIDMRYGISRVDL